jgi:hypothetical protein
VNNSLESIGRNQSNQNSQSERRGFKTKVERVQLHLTLESEAGKACTAEAQGLNFEMIKCGQFLDGMDAFYKDFRNTEYPLHAAIKLVRDQINGRATEDIEKELIAWRQCRADSSKCLTPASSTKQTTPK